MTRKCRYANCNFPDKIIYLDHQPYVEECKKYYHESCHQEVLKAREVNKILQEIKEIWIKEISNTVNVPQLIGIVKRDIAKGIDAEYILFTLKYIINNKYYTLNYPGGLSYYYDNKIIKDAYRKSKIKYVPLQSFKVTNTEGISFNVKKNKKSFDSILNK